MLTALFNHIRYQRKGAEPASSDLPGIGRMVDTDTDTATDTSINSMVSEVTASSVINPVLFV